MAKQEEQTQQKETATLAGGCFWCTEAVFNSIRGVEKVESGYSGGKTENPSYAQVSTGATGHAEAVQITFNPQEITYEDILEIFFTTHDPTTLNRQGPDVGTQYRSVIFYHNPQQKEKAENIIRQLNSQNLWNKPIVTSVEPFKAFYKAEGYHKNYFQQHPEQAYCQLIIAPKLAKLREHYQSKLKLQI
jgi:peptide-methionine (S)-S-oxide reductase